MTAPNFLIVRLSAHGDVIQTLPVLARLKAHCPEATVGWLVEAGSASLLAGHPQISRLHVLPRKDWQRRLRQLCAWPGVFREIWAFLAEVRGAGYTVALDVQGLLKSALWPALAGIRHRVGYAWTREAAWLFYTDTVARHDLKDPHLPTAQVFCRLADWAITHVTGQAPPAWHLDDLAYPLPPPEPESAQRVASWLSGWTPPLTALSPATMWASKHWPEAHWHRLMAELAQRPGTTLLLGGPNDRALAERLAVGWPEGAPNRLVSLVGETQLADLRALLPHVETFIGPDSGPLHLAAAVAAEAGQPRIIGLYGPTAPGRTGPLGARHQTVSTALDCQPCFERRCPLKTDACMQALTPESVWNRV